MHVLINHQLLHKKIIKSNASKDSVIWYTWMGEEGVEKT